MKIALFDLDETLVTQDCRIYSLMLICKKIAKLSKKKPKYIFNTIIKIWHKEKNKKMKYDWDSHIKKLCKKLKIKQKFNYEREIKANLNKAKLFPDAIYILKYLKSKRYQVHIITNGLRKYQYPIIKQLKLLKYVRSVYTPYDGIIKPNIKILKNQFNHKDIDLYVDDQLYQGIYLGKKIKSTTVLIARKYHGNLSQYFNKKIKNELKEQKFKINAKHLTPDYIVTDLRQIKGIINLREFEKKIK